MPNRPATSPDDPRFWARVDKESDPEGCWLWTGRLDKGYGIFARIPAHRWLFKVMGRELPDGWHVGHVCHDRAYAAGTCPGGECKHRACVRPEHMAAQTPGQNALASGATSAVNRRKETAACGHPFTGERRGWRYCVPCNKADKLRKQLLYGQAADALGMTRKQYLAEHGYSQKKAHEVLARSAAPKVRLADPPPRSTRSAVDTITLC